MAFRKQQIGEMHSALLLMFVRDETDERRFCCVIGFCLGSLLNF